MLHLQHCSLFAPESRNCTSFMFVSYVLRKKHFQHFEIAYSVLLCYNVVSGFNFMTCLCT
jgi:hypothetical protein